MRYSVVDMAKYDSLRDYLRKQDKDVVMTFSDVATVIGCSILTDSAFIHSAWWTNDRTHGQARAWLAAGYTASADINTNTVTFRRFFDIYKVLKEVSKNRMYQGMFVSEGSLQFELVEMIHRLYPDYKVIAEFPYTLKSDSNSHIDIMVITNEGKLIPIELKSKTREESVIINSYEIKLKTQGAANDNSWAYLEDIERLESVMKLEKGKYLIGYTLFLTNDPAYLKKEVSGQYASYWIGNDCKSTGLKQRVRTNRKTREKTYSNLKLTGSYTHYWKDFFPVFAVDKLTEDSCGIWYLVDEIV